jgi:hypothetical protein
MKLRLNGQASELRKRRPSDIYKFSRVRWSPRRNSESSTVDIQLTIADADWQSGVCRGSWKKSVMEHWCIVLCETSARGLTAEQSCDNVCCSRTNQKANVVSSLFTMRPVADRRRHESHRKDQSDVWNSAAMIDALHKTWTEVIQLIMRI